MKDSKSIVRLKIQCIFKSLMCWSIVRLPLMSKIGHYSLEAVYIKVLY